SRSTILRRKCRWITPLAYARFVVPLQDAQEARIHCRAIKIRELCAYFAQQRAFGLATTCHREVSPFDTRAKLALAQLSRCFTLRPSSLSESLYWLFRWSRIRIPFGRLSNKIIKSLI